MPNNGIPEYFASLRYIERKISYSGHIEGTTKPRGGCRYCHGIRLFGKNTMSLFMSLFKTSKGISRIFRQFTVHPPVYGTPASLRYTRQFTVHWTKISLLRAQQNQDGDTNTVYCHGIPLSGKTYKFVFHLVLVLDLEDLRLSSSTKKPGVQQIHVVHLIRLIVRNTAVTQTQQGTTFLVLENPTVRHIYVVPEYTIMAAVLNQV